MQQDGAGQAGEPGDDDHHGHRDGDRHAADPGQVGVEVGVEGVVVGRTGQDQQLVYPVLTRDRQAMADLVRSQLGPLQQARGGAEPLLKTLSAYFDAGCVAAETARQLALSVRALTYRLERVHQLTGSDPSDPMHRYTLQTAVIGARLLDWRPRNSDRRVRPLPDPGRPGPERCSPHAGILTRA